MPTKAKTPSMEKGDANKKPDVPEGYPAEDEMLDWRTCESGSVGWVPVSVINMDERNLFNPRYKIDRDNIRKLSNKGVANLDPALVARVPGFDSLGPADGVHRTQMVKEEKGWDVIKVQVVEFEGAYEAKLRSFDINTHHGMSLNDLETAKYCLELHESGATLKDITEQFGKKFRVSYVSSLTHWAEVSSETKNSACAEKNEDYEKELSLFAGATIHKLNKILWPKYVARYRKGGLNVNDLKSIVKQIRDNGGKDVTEDVVDEIKNRKSAKAKAPGEKTDEVITSGSDEVEPDSKSGGSPEILQPDGDVKTDVESGKYEIKEKDATGYEGAHETPSENVAGSSGKEPELMKVTEVNKGLKNLFDSFQENFVGFQEKFVSFQENFASFVGVHCEPEPARSMVDRIRKTAKELNGISGELNGFADALNQKAEEFNARIKKEIEKVR